MLIDSRTAPQWALKDSRELALQDWMGSAHFDRPERCMAAQMG